MKSLVKILNILIVLLAFTVGINAQTFDAPTISAGNSELVIDFGMSATALDSAAADTTTHFSLEDYDATDGDVFTLFTDLASGGTPKFTVAVQGSEDLTTWATLDTPLSNSAVTTPVWTPFDIADKRAKYYRLIATNVATGAALTGYWIKIRASAKDNKVN